jgi:hypothetical protein
LRRKVDLLTADLMALEVDFEARGDAVNDDYLDKFLDRVVD